jgi:hypothetical protein
MPSDQKPSQDRELLEADERELGGAPHVDEESAAEEDMRARSTLGDKASFEDDEDVEDDDIAEEIDLDDLAAMEGPDW